MILNLESLLDEDFNTTTTYSKIVFSFLSFLCFAILVRATREKDPDKQKLKLNVPLCPFGYYETIKAFVGCRFHSLLESAFKEVGPCFQIKFGLDSGVVVVGDVDIIRDVLGDRNAKKPTKFYSYLRFIHGEKNDILSSDEGDFHAKSRKGMAHAFSSKHIRRMREVSVRHTDQFIQNTLGKYKESGESFDISNEMLSLTFDIILEAAFQYHMANDVKKQFLEELEINLKECYKEQIPLRRKLGFLIPGVRRGKQAQSFIRKVGFDIIQSYKNLDSKDRITGTVIDCIMKNDKAYTCDAERISDIIILILAGHETTAFSLAWTFIQLALHQDIQNELRLDLLNEERQTFEECTKSKYLDSVIKESMRIKPAVATGSARYSQKDYSIDNDKYFIPKGTLLSFPPIIYLLNGEYFEEPYKFKPSRWNTINNYKDINTNSEDSSSSSSSEEKERQLKLQEKVFLPFAMGRRNCIGQSLALAELYSIVPRIVQKFNVRVEAEGTEEFFLTLKPKNWYLRVE